jgi:CubicO group peptidase (beta-lactamase class C family)
MAVALAESRKLLDYDERVATYWPEFAQHGKHEITVRQLLAHQAGLYAFRETADALVVADLDRLAEVMARERPEWPAGERQAYHGLTIGYYEGELLRRVDARRRSLGRFFADEIARPLALEFYIGLPHEIPDSRLATLTPAAPWRALLTVPPALAIAGLYPRSRIRRALEGSLLPLDPQHVYRRSCEVPAGGGVGTARAIAKAYGVFATGGKELGLRAETLHDLMAPPRPPARGFRDAALKVEVRFALGFSKPDPKHPFGHPGAFGMPGAGGSFGFADPQVGIGYGYTPNRMGTYLEDPRDRALRAALYGAIGAGELPRR